MIELRNLTKSYPTPAGRRYVFKDLNFRLPDGAGIGLIGRNGAGKSTLMRLLGGIDYPDRGEVVTSQSISWPVALGGGFQGSLSARENVRFVCRIMGMHGPEMKERVRYVEEFSEIGEWFDLPMNMCSPGMRARVTFGTSMAFDFDYYLIDEALAVGDPIFRKKASAVFKAKLERAGVILVSHNHKEIQELCSALILVHQGQALAFDDVTEGLATFKELTEND